ncbi:MAG TPA: nucleotide exchange factor GrpE [Vicinamibacteria bacterium]|nr:nucleotide exchange factor GrpE [Vicinamibacteria bacterium]
MSDKPGNGGAPPDAAVEDPDKPVEPTGLEVAPEGQEPPLTREALEALRRERDELRDQLLRRRADFENYKKRVERDRVQAERAATARVCQALLPVLDDFDRALEALPPDTPMRAGVELIQRQVLALLESEGVKAKDPTGEAFDPEMHQALSYESVPGFSDGTVVETFRKAYFLGGRLLRPALVKVARGEAEAKSGDEPVH